MNKRVKLGIILSSDVGFEGVQIFDITPEIQQEALIILPRLHPLLRKLGEVVKSKEVTRESSDHHNSR